MTVQTISEEQVEEALRLVASRNLAAASAVQRWMRISFRDASALLDELERRGFVGPADGSRARDVLVRYCEQCGRIGKRGYRTLSNDEHGISITVCSNKAACRKRWPKPARDDD
ncbi:DNA translocase FtsK [Streptomyces sp. Z423-1]|uniref:DNA translocase FtsK n=1 Tax=unclassified Streptomyces TaxID=2593676 RepID=UPI00148881EC|nr:DNA translocase FtsK [Streptomyces sp. Z423-1]